MIKATVKTIALYVVIGAATQAGNWVWRYCLENKANQAVNSYQKRKKYKCKTVKFRKV